MNDAAQVYPYTLRLFVDVDPSGGPIGAGLIHFQRGSEIGTVLFFVPGPFDTLRDVQEELRSLYHDQIGSQSQLL